MQKLQETLFKIKIRSEEVNIIKSLESCLSHVSIEERCRLLRKNNTLQSVAERGHKDTIKYLLDGVSVDQKVELLKRKSRGGHTAIINATREGHTDTIKYLLDGVSVDKKVELLKVQDKCGYTAIQRAAFKGHTDIIEYLLDGVSVDQKVELLKIQSKYGSTAIHNAAWEGHTDTIILMMLELSAKQQLELLQTHSTDNETPSSVANRTGQLFRFTLMCFTDSFMAENLDNKKSFWLMNV